MTRLYKAVWEEAASPPLAALGKQTGLLHVLDAQHPLQRSTGTQPQVRYIHSAVLHIRYSVQLTSTFCEKMPFPWDLDPSNTWFQWATQIRPTQTTSRSVQQFCTAYDCDKHTDRQTHRPCIGIYRTYMYVLMKCDLIMQVIY